MKRPPERWLLLMLGILLFLHETHCVRATSLIFAKTTTTTTSTEAPAADVEDGESSADQTSSSNSELSAEGNGTNTPQLTGIPQIDYIWDPNLPRELNGFNLTDYPFYEILPKDIDFKCDGLHDGFYASVPHKCQVYHHCLFGTRYDFLCANYTAFDQKTFICHFVSEVDCVNSPKYWHRNDALYQAASTTTIAPPTTQRVVTIAAPAPVAPRRPVASAGGRRRRPPARRRRPQYDYYDEYDYETDRDRDQDDYYDEPRYQATEAPRSNGRRRKRPRPVNRRPEYDEYEEYEDDRYNRRGTGRRDEERRRPSKKPYHYDDEEYEDAERRPQGDRRRPDKTTGRKPDETRPRRPMDTDDYDRRPYNRNKNSKNRPRPIEEDRYDEKDERRPLDSRRKDEMDNRRRPMEDKEDRRSFDRRKNEDDESTRQRFRPRDDDRKTEAKVDKGLIKPSSGSSVYDKPRAPPIIRRPVPKTERDKYDYKPFQGKTKPTPPQEEEEYYDDYEEELSIKTTTTLKPEPERRYKPKRNYRPYKPDYELRGTTTKKPLDEPTEDVRRPLKGTDDRRKVAESRKPKPDIQSPESDNFRPKRPYDQDDSEEPRRPNESRRPFRRPDDFEDNRRHPDDLLDIRRPPLEEKRPNKRTDEPSRPLEDSRFSNKRPDDFSDSRRPPQEDKRFNKRPDDSQRPLEDLRPSNKRPEDPKRPQEERRQRPDDSYSFKSNSQEKFSEDLRRSAFKRPEDDSKRPFVESRRPNRPPENLKDILGATDDVSEEIVVNKRPQRKPIEENFDDRRNLKRPESSERKTKFENRFVQPKAPPAQKPDYDEEYDDNSQSKEDYKDSREELPTLQRPSKFTLSSSQSKIKDEVPSRSEVPNKPETRYPEKEVVNREPVVRIVKRPFLPSRGGNPYVGRGLQPVGVKAQNSEKLNSQNDAPVSENPKKMVTKDFLMKTSSEEYYDDSESEYSKPQPPVYKALPKEPTIEDIFKPVTTRPKMNFRNIFRSEQQQFSIRPQSTTEIKTTTQKIETETYKNPLDINENEYDVTLNDALNPTIPNLPIRNVPSGFGSGSDLVNSYKKALNSRNYQYNQPYQRPRFVAIEAPLNPSGSEYVYHQVKEQSQQHKSPNLQSASSNPSYSYVSAPLAYQNSYQQHLTGQYYTLG